MFVSLQTDRRITEHPSAFIGRLYPDIAATKPDLPGIRLDPETILFNLDGICGRLKHNHETIAITCKHYGEMLVFGLRGGPGHTELALFSRLTNKTGIWAFANPKATYAYVLFTDNVLSHGCLHLREDGTFTIS